MLGHLPRPAADELFYSIVARGVLMAGASNAAGITQSGFGRVVGSVNFDPPTRLGQFLASLHGHVDYMPVDELIAQHTSLPYHAAFLPPADVARARGIVAGGGSLGPVLRFTAGVPHAKPALCCCPSCIEEDEAQLGMCTWKRVHQLPGVLNCPRHGIPLLSTRVTGNQRSDCRPFIALDKAVAAAATPLVPPSGLPPAWVAVARESEWLLAAGLPALETSELRTRVAGFALRQGYSRGNGKPDGPRVCSAMVETFGVDGLAGLGCAVDLAFPYDEWPYFLWRGRASGRRLQPALRYLLLAVALGGTLRELLSEPPSDDRGMPDYQPRQKLVLASASEGLACLNPACRRHDPDYPESLSSRVTGKERLEVSCQECGFCYRWNPRHPRLFRIVETGASWDGLLRRKMEEGLSIRDIGELLHVDPLTAKRQAVRLGIERPNWTRNKATEQSRMSRMAETRAWHRSEWERLTRENPGILKTGFRRMALATYQWLQDADGEWLARNLPGPHAKRRPCVDWPERDCNLVARAEAKVPEVLASLPARRVTPHVVAQALGAGRFANAAYSGKLPSFQAFLASHTESHADFRARRRRLAHVGD